jgi:hypothetical protein
MKCRQPASHRVGIPLGSEGGGAKITNACMHVDHGDFSFLPALLRARSLACRRGDVIVMGKGLCAGRDRHLTLSAWLLCTGCT